MKAIKNISLSSITCAVCLCSNFAFAAHPLNSDDTGVQGAKHWQFELNTDRSRIKDDNAGKLTNQSINAGLTYGITDNLDFAINVPYEMYNLKDNANYFPSSSQKGLGDITAQFKWNFYNSVDNKFSLALRPAITFATGNEDKSLGNGKSTQSLNLLAQYTLNDWAFLFNAGYTRNNNSFGDRKSLWNTSAAALYTIGKNTIALDAGIERNADPSSDAKKVLPYILIGDIYHLNKDLDLDIGYRHDFDKDSSSDSIGVGLTKRW